MARLFVLLISLGLVSWFVYTRADDLAALPAYLQQVTATQLLILFGLEAIFFLLTARSNQLVYRTQQVNSSLLNQLRLLLAAGTIERLLPSGGAAGTSSYIWLARRLGISVANSVKMTAASFLLGYLQLIPLLFIPLFLTSSNHLPPAKIQLLVIVATGFIVLIIGLSWLIGSARLLHNLQNGPFLSRFPRIYKAWRTAHEHLRQIWQRRTELMRPLFYLWLLYPIRIGMLGVTFHALQVQVPAAALWAGYSITILISFLTFLPTTLGVFELSMAGTFVLLGVASDKATAATLLYRLFTYWLPIPFGLLAWWNLRKQVMK